VPIVPRSEIQNIRHELLYNATSKYVEIMVDDRVYYITIYYNPMKRFLMVKGFDMADRYNDTSIHLWSVRQQRSIRYSSTGTNVQRLGFHWFRNILPGRYVLIFQHDKYYPDRRTVFALEVKIYPDKLFVKLLPKHKAEELTRAVYDETRQMAMRIGRMIRDSLRS